jgi:hypothetical protein
MFSRAQLQMFSRAQLQMFLRAQLQMFLRAQDGLHSIFKGRCEQSIAARHNDLFLELFLGFAKSSRIVNLRKIGGLFENVLLNAWQ